MEEMKETTPEITPKKKKSKVAAIILIVIIVAIIGALAGGGKEKDNGQPDDQQNQQPQQQQDAQNTETDMSVVASAIKAVLDKNADGTGVEYAVSYDDEGITITAKANGVAAEVSQAKASGYDDTYEPWVTMRDNMVTLCNSISDAAEALGASGKYVIVNVANDANEDNTLLTIMNGVVVYDVMAG